MAYEKVSERKFKLAKKIDIETVYDMDSVKQQIVTLTVQKVAIEQKIAELQAVKAEGLKVGVPEEAPIVEYLEPVEPRIEPLPEPKKS
jgi:hypothetical protein